MVRIIRITVLFIFICSMVFSIGADVSAVSQYSDLISKSWPSYPANHTISFKIAEAIPPSGKIVITPAVDKFQLIPGFSFTDIDLATATAMAGPYSDRELAAAPDAQADGVNIDSWGASSTLNSITITLNSSYGIDNNTFVRIKLGTIASYGATGIAQIVNATSTGAYQIEVNIYDSGNKLLDRGTAYVVMIDPVAMAAGLGKIRSNGTPNGVLTYGTTQSLMSLNTNYLATCRFSTASGTAYADMTNDFSFTGQYFHSTLLTGLANGQSYTYYIRCRDQNLVDDTSDFIVTFEVSGQEGDEGEESGDPGPGGGGSGGGGGGGQGQDRGRGSGDYLPYPPPPGQPGVVFTGWAEPSALVYILKDGAQMGKVLANNKAEFGAYLEELPQGVYTFGLWAEDLAGRKTPTFSTTFWIDDGTQSTVSDIILPPTISITNNEVAAGETVEILGYAIPGKKVEVWFYPEMSAAVPESLILKREVLATAEGKWTAFVNTSGLDNGQYKVKAKVNYDDVGTSGFSLVLSATIGGNIEEAVCSGADLNHDERVNITDFSILLYYWNSDDACADQNKDGNVDLIDFSIMMFYWTG